MNTEQFNNMKKQEYQERYRFWVDKRISQLSFQNNIYLTIGIAALGYFWSERNRVYTDLIVDVRLAIDWKLVLFFAGMLSLSYSIASGLFLSVSRLYDLRLISNILLTRKRAIKENIKITDEDTSNNSVFKSIKSLWKIFWNYNKYEISDGDMRGDQEELQKKFTKARQLSRDIGNSSWILIKNQTVSLFLAICLLAIVLIIK
jgi:hypothetical protein